MREDCVICGEEANYKCQHERTLKIRYYCEKHKPDYEEVCMEYKNYDTKMG